ncbi:MULTISPECIES: LysE family translocator [Weeksella]|uniref:Lysine exporter protein (LYSE/YGGA) n=1 Tax=Weeksella virosa (strain ATCC 43766 / DSM 16922 / JCM 21250 / CCUG 30538 / CDC 9751 / IAM 14551 / NBRC 16016 / NCTC 11634 / CL345/78) TaxID=865938 RepID=F0P213_WEEVC|nr:MULTISPECIES: LysE family transporter [Weeksella]ADX67723.1 Lysine exporter protein (LYSE/YGGA) [Weeksella virosa DSM 16922]MDK7374015.1 LysE family transporter [Weeksella virosa]MDK7674270.1 LysE family transporter [Weeksella virosa]OFM82700.1 lysine transporter LysE [Weeksella sp. HMSC059D05]SUP54022.1 homoserine/Threonine efflux protein [Weeksella virosa]
MELIVSAFIVGCILSIFLIGPVFFLLIDTSLNKGWRSAIVLDLGVIAADVLCIAAAYYGSKDFANYVNTHPKYYQIYIIAGFFIIVYGFFMYFSKPSLHLGEETGIVGKNYLKTFFNGFVLNLLNVGVIVFWFVIVSSIIIKYPDPTHFVWYMSVVLSTYFSIDVIKIFLADKVKSKITDDKVFMIRKVVGICLLIFGIIIGLKGFGFFQEIDQRIENKLKLEERI